MGTFFDVEDEDYSFGINLLECDNVASRNARRDTYTRVYNVFNKIWEDEWGVWLQLILQNVFRAFIENQGYTLADVPMFLNPKNTAFREHIISNIKYEPEVADFWRYEFFNRREPNQQERVDAALTRINTLLTDPDVRDIVGQQKTTLNFDTLLSLPNILLFKLSSNLAEDTKKFIGTILLNELVWAVRNRPEDERSQFCVFVDEMQNFVSTNHHMDVLVTEGRKFGVASTFMHVERLGQLAYNQRLMGATQAIVNKVLFQQTPHDAEELAPEFAKKVEATEKRHEAELVFSSHAVEDIWDRGHPNELNMMTRDKYYWIVDLLRKSPQEEYFLFDPSKLQHHCDTFPTTGNPHLEYFADSEYYRANAEMVQEGIALLNRHHLNWMNKRYTQTEQINGEQEEIILKIIECLGGLYGLRPSMEPYIKEEMRDRLMYLATEKFRELHDREKQSKLRVLRDKYRNLSSHVDYVRNHSPVRPSGNYYTRLIEEEQLNRVTELWNEIIALENSQPPIPPEIPRTTLTVHDIKEVQKVAIKAGMPAHEVEKLISWQPRPLDAAEKEIFRLFIKTTADDAYKKSISKTQHQKLMDACEQKWFRYIEETANPPLLCEVTGTFSDIIRKIRADPIARSPAQIEKYEHVLNLKKRGAWQIMETHYLMIAVFLVSCVNLQFQPVKTPSGKYDESLRVERTQQDLNNEIAQELQNLNPHTAYTKIIVDNTVKTHKIKTYPLPEGRHSDIEEHVLDNAHMFGKRREDISTEIRERQAKWLRGGESSPLTKKERGQV